MKEKKIYSLIGKMALEFRLSLDNICKIMNKPVTDETKMEIYENIINYAYGDNYFQLKKAYEFLFNYETVNESPTSSLIAYNKAKNYLLRHNNAIRENNKEKAKEIRKELTKTDADFKNLMTRGHGEQYVIDDITIISQYRIKYAVSRETFCEDYKFIPERTLIEKEQNIDDEILSHKLNLLSDYYLNFVNNKLRRR